MPISFTRTQDGVSTQVCRVRRGNEVFYLRLAEEPDDDLFVDAELHRQLLRRGVSVPDIVYVERFDAALGRSAMITTEVAGAPLSEAPTLETASAVVRDAGADLAVLNQIDLEGFGWVKRDQVAWPLRAELKTYREFVRSYLPHAWSGGLAALFAPPELAQIEAIASDEERRDLAQGRLAHGDFDVTAIFHEGDQYSGIIDFGEIRGAKPTFDLGHFLLHDGETLPWRLFDSLVEGYRDAVELPQDYRNQVRTSAVLLGLRQLCRWIGPERGAPVDHPSGTRPSAADLRPP